MEVARAALNTLEYDEVRHARFSGINLVIKLLLVSPLSDLTPSLAADRACAPDHVRHAKWQTIKTMKLYTAPCIIA